MEKNENGLTDEQQFLVDCDVESVNFKSYRKPTKKEMNLIAFGAVNMQLRINDKCKDSFKQVQENLNSLVEEFGKDIVPESVLENIEEIDQTYTNTNDNTIDLYLRIKDLPTYVLELENGFKIATQLGIKNLIHKENNDERIWFTYNNYLLDGEKVYLISDQNSVSEEIINSGEHILDENLTKIYGKYCLLIYSPEKK